MDMRGVAFLAALGATTIYALNHTIAKVIMPNYIGALDWFASRNWSYHSILDCKSIYKK